MEIVEWSDAYSVGNVLMDAHHRVFFQMVKEFSEAPDQDMRATMQQQIAFLAEYVIMHLAAEESLMREAGYPDIDKHKVLAILPASTAPSRWSERLRPKATMVASAGP